MCPFKKWYLRTWPCGDSCRIGRKLINRFQSRSLPELTWQITPPTQNGHAPPPKESRKSSQSVNPYYIWTWWVICLVYSDNERDLSLLTSRMNLVLQSTGFFLALRGAFGFFGRVRGGLVWIDSCFGFLKGLSEFHSMEDWGNNRSVMPLDVLGRTRATLRVSMSLPLSWKASEIFRKSLVMGIDSCKYWSWTRNS